MLRALLALVLVFGLVSVGSAADDAPSTKVEKLALWHSVVCKRIKLTISKQKLLLEIDDKNKTAKQALQLAEESLKGSEADPVGATVILVEFDAKSFVVDTDLAPCKFKKAPLIAATDEYVIFKNTIDKKTYTVKIIGEKAGSASKGDQYEAAGWYEVVERPKGIPNMVVLKTVTFSKEEIEQARKLAAELEKKK